jgi:adhesin transport system outer membrane protein
VEWLFLLTLGLHGWLALNPIELPTAPVPVQIVPEPAPPPPPPPAPPPPAPVPPPPPPTADVRVILLPSRDARDSAVVLRQGAVEQALTQPFASISALSDGRLQAAVEDPDDVRRRYAQVLAAQPLPPRRYTLYFLRNSPSALQPSSREAWPGLIEDLKHRPAPEIVLVGHADRAGTARRNETLSRQRAQAVRAWLERTGLPIRSISVEALGEQSVEMPTPDGRREKRNRRVEIHVR